MVIDWLAAGVDPTQATLFIQSRVPEHAELHLLLSMITPLGWLERVPTYKDQQEKLADRDLSTYGFLGYPLLQAADILIYRATLVPVGEDQVPHIEFTREIARRFNHLYRPRAGLRGQGARGGEEARRQGARALFDELRTHYQEQGDAEALEQARTLLDERRTCRSATASALFGFLEGGRQDDPGRARGAADRSSQACPASTDRRCPSPTATRSAARGAEGGDEEDPHACRPTRRACDAAIRASRRIARCGSCTWCIRAAKTQ